ncbi:MAG: cytochrome b/b6 domain-containing protein [Gammaproteobacteria bacterium]
MPLESVSPVSRRFVWDRSVRLFHWINVACILILAAVGLMLLNGKALGLGNEGKLLLKTVHVSIGYVFFLNLGWRILWAFVSANPYSRWKEMVPWGKNFGSALKLQLERLKHGQTDPHLGHNPLGKIMIALLLLLMLVQAGTGLILAGTDLYYPPFGSKIATWVATPGNDGKIKPYSKDYIDAGRYDEMRSLRAPVVALHQYNFYALLTLIVLHVAAAVFQDIREKNGLISAMFNGYKFMREQSNRK